MKVGFTGHQDLGDNSTQLWVKQALQGVIQRGEIQLGYMSLAIGADQLFAQLLLDENIPFVAIIPSRDYVTTFYGDEHIIRYKELLAQARQVITLERDFASEEAFYEAGRKVVDSTDFLIAVWNAKQAKGLGGTADIVHYALTRKKRVIHLNPLSQTVSELSV